MRVLPIVNAPTRTLSWLGLTSIGAVVALVPAFVVESAVGSAFIRHPDVAGGDAPLRLGVAAATWVTVTALLTLGTSRLVDPALVLAHRRLVGVTAGAAVTAGLAEFGVTEWAVLALGQYDAEFPDASMLVPLSSVASTAGVVGYLASAGQTRKLAGALATAASILVLAWALTNVRGLGDGLSDGAWALGVAVVAVALYTVGIAIAMRAAPTNERSSAAIC